MACSAADDNQPAQVVRIAAPAKRQRTLGTDCDLNRGVMVDGKIGKCAGNHEPTRPQVPHTHCATVALFILRVGSIVSGGRRGLRPSGVPMDT